MKTLMTNRLSSEIGTPKVGGQYTMSRRRSFYPTSIRKSPTRYTAANQPCDGWAARRDPEANVRVFYDAGLYDQ
jgi:hypothetical protein